MLSMAFSIPAARWWCSIAATRRRWVAGAAGQAVVNASMVAASAGKAWWWVAAHQSVNSAQSAAYPVIVVVASGRLVTADRCELAIYLADSLHAKWHGLRTLVRVQGVRTAERPNKSLKMAK